MRIATCAVVGQNGSPFTNHGARRVVICSLTVFQDKRLISSFVSCCARNSKLTLTVPPQNPYSPPSTFSR